MIQMRALVAFDRNGKHLKVGDQFSAYPIEAASLRYQRQAEFVRPTAGAQRGYQTRHMEAQRPSAAPPPPPEAPQEASSVPTQTADAESTQTTDAGQGGRSGRRAARAQGYQTRQLNQRGASEG